jgi:hypothetical protein
MKILFRWFLSAFGFAIIFWTGTYFLVKLKKDYTAESVVKVVTYMEEVALGKQELKPSDLPFGYGSRVAVTNLMNEPYSSSSAGVSMDSDAVSIYITYDTFPFCAVIFTALSVVFFVFCIIAFIIQVCTKKKGAYLA